MSTSTNPYINYYVNQAGSGIGGFQGARFQRGQGFFGNVFRNAIMPLLKYFGKTALSTGADVAMDAIDGEDLMGALKKRGRATAKNIASDAAERATRFVQTGRGKKRKRRSTKAVSKKKRVSLVGRGKKKKRPNNLRNLSIF